MSEVEVEDEVLNDESEAEESDEELDESEEDSEPEPEPEPAPKKKAGRPPKAKEAKAPKPAKVVEPKVKVLPPTTAKPKPKAKPAPVVRPEATEADEAYLPSNAAALAWVSKQLKFAGDVTRLQILGLIDGEKNVGDICHFLYKSQPAVSHHLALMRAGGLIVPVRDGKVNRYILQPKGKAVLKAIKLVMATRANSDDD